MNNKCIYCGAEIEIGSNFCNHCGKKQARVYTARMERNGLSTADFIIQINNALAQNPCIANVKCRFELKGGMGLFIDKFNLNAVEFEYELFSSPNIYQYRVAELSQYILWSSRHGKTGADLLEEWKAQNPNCTVVSSTSGSHSKGNKTSLTGDWGTSRKVQVFVLYKEITQNA